MANESDGIGTLVANYVRLVAADKCRASAITYRAEERMVASLKALAADGMDFEELAKCSGLTAPAVAYWVGE